MILYCSLALIVVLGILITYFAYKKIMPRPNEEMDNIHIHFKMNQKVTAEIKKSLEDYIEKNDADRETFYKEVTFAAVLRNLEKDYGTYLQPSFESNNRNLSHTDIETICNNMEKHFHELLQLQREVNLRLQVPVGN